MGRQVQGGDSRTVLVVETARFGSGDLIGAVQLEAAKGPCRFVVLVPLSGGQQDGGPSGGLMWLAAGDMQSKFLVKHAEERARRRLDAEVARISALRVPVEGDLVYDSLMAAIGKHVRSGVRTVIVSEPSRWTPLRLLATRIRLRFRVRVVAVLPD